MTITLTPQQVHWLEAEVQAGRLSSIEDGVRLAVAELMMGSIDEDDALDWAKPLVDEARAEVDQGRKVSLDEFQEHAARRLKSLQR